VRFGVLGPLVVADATGAWLRLRGDRQRSLLAMLLFNANQAVSTERLVGALWPDIPPKSYASNLQTYVSRLRERLGSLRLDHAGGGYRLAVADDELDMLVFLTESQRGRRAAREGDPVAAAAHLRRALAQWRDHPLAGLHVPALDPEIARLETERLTVFEDCMDAELAAGRHAELVGELQAAVAEQPLRERLAGQLMVALQRSGRQADALEVYRATRARLIEETGIEPGPDLRRLHTKVLRGEPGGPPPAQTPALCQLPTDIADFSGRQEALDELIGLVQAHRVPLVVLGGEPGVGKSTLAVRVAHRARAAFPDGQLFVNLAGASNPRDPAEVLGEWLGVLGVTSVPDGLEARAATFRTRLADRRMLVLLDDAADPAQVRPLLPGTASSVVIVTSRRRLSGLEGAHRVPVRPFTDAEAGQLLERIAGDRVTGAPVDAARIAAACGNLPLALRIAGTRLALRPHLQLSALADRLEDELRRLDELAVSDLEVRTSLTLSYRALSEPARATLRLIGIVDVANLPAWAITVLQGSDALRLRGEEDVGASDGDGAVEELVESSLLEPAGEDDSGEPRYRVHDLVRAFARELALAKDGLQERELASSRLVDAALALTDLAGRRLPRMVPMPESTAEVPALPLAPEKVRRLLADPEAWFATERPAIVAGLTLMCRVGQYEKAMQLFERVGHYLWLHGHHADLNRCADSLATAARAAGDERIETRAEAVLALLLHVRGQYTPAVAMYRRCVDRLERLADPFALAWTLINLANCLIGLGYPEESLRLAARAGELIPGDDFGTISVLRTRSAALHRLGRPHESVRIDTEVLDLARRTGEAPLLAIALQGLSWSLTLIGDLDRAVGLAQEAVTLLRGTTARSSLSRSLRSLGAIQAGRGERDLALRAFHEARAIAEEINEQARVISCTRAIAASWIGDGRARAAIPELRRCLVAYREMGSVPAAVITLRLLAVAYESTGDTDAAERARADAARIDDPRDASARTLLTLLENLTAVGAGSTGTHCPAR
jgi:DNA-binding SARP family transcriptional activator/tetratricopeptide (TPR) repeat protein